MLIKWDKRSARFIFLCLDRNRIRTGIKRYRFTTISVLSLIHVLSLKSLARRQNLSFRFISDLVDLTCFKSTKNSHVTNDRRYPPVSVMLQNHNNGVPSNGSDKALWDSSPIGSYYLVTDKAGLRIITGGSVTNDLSAPTILRIARTYLPLLRSLPAIYVTSWHVNRSRCPDDKLVDKLDANSISRMFRREVTRGLQNENRSIFLVSLFLPSRM